MSAPTLNPPLRPNPHLPLQTVPNSLNRDQITDLCNYTVLRAIAFELNKVRSGFYTFSEMEHAITHYATQADEIAHGRWPSVDPDAYTPSSVLAASPTPTQETGGSETPVDTTPNPHHTRIRITERSLVVTTAHQPPPDGRDTHIIPAITE